MFKNKKVGKGVFTSFIRLTILFFFLFITQTCKDDDDNPIKTGEKPEQEIKIGLLTIGEFQSAAIQEIPSGGGEITVTGTASPLDGFTLSSPANAYADSRTYTISYAAIKKHELGKDFNPLSSVIRIENGGGYAEGFISLSIPISLPENHFAAAFMYSPEGGLELIPGTALSSTEIKVVANHFDYEKIVEQRLKGGRVAAANRVDIIIGSVPIEELKDLEVQTKFTPGVDDWEFVNDGSLASPMGICSGMSVTAMWYYENLKSINGNLFGNQKLGEFYIPTTGIEKDKLWMDNAKGIKFASMAQVKKDIDNIDNTILKYIAHLSSLTTGSNLAKEVASFYELKYFLKLKPDPLYLYIRDEAKSVAHAIIIYGVNSKEIMVADPNYPGDVSRKIVFSLNEGFQPYFGGINQSSDSKLKFDYFFVMPRTLVNFSSSLSTLWQKAQNNTIGKECFVDYKFRIRDNDGPELADKAVIFNGLTVDKNCESCRYTLYDTLGERILPDINGIRRLERGKLQKIGLYIEDKTAKACNGASVSYSDKDRFQGYRWNNFKWINVTDHDLKIASQGVDLFLTPGETNREYTFLAESTWEPTAKDKLVWSFEDAEHNSTEISIEGDKKVKYIFKEKGHYVTTLKILNEKGENLTTLRSGIITIEEKKPDTKACKPILMSEGWGGYRVDAYDGVIEYDGNGRISKYYENSYRYKELKYDDNGLLIQVDEIELQKIYKSSVIEYNAQGNWTKITSIYSNVQEIMTTEYDDQGNRIKIVSSDGTVYTFEYTDGNLTKSTTYLTTDYGSEIITHRYEYDTSKENLVAGFFDFLITDLFTDLGSITFHQSALDDYNQYVATPSKHMLKKIYAEGTWQYSVLNLIYSYNDKGYAIKKTITGKDNHGNDVDFNGDGVINQWDSEITEYIYHCEY